jgi:hypothetical protein
VLFQQFLSTSRDQAPGDLAGCLVAPPLRPLLSSAEERDWSFRWVDALIGLSRSSSFKGALGQPTPGLHHCSCVPNDHNRHNRELGHPRDRSPEQRDAYLCLRSTSDGCFLRRINGSFSHVGAVPFSFSNHFSWVLLGAILADLLNFRNSLAESLMSRHEVPNLDYRCFTHLREHSNCARDSKIDRVGSRTVPPPERHCQP